MSDSDDNPFTMKNLRAAVAAAPAAAAAPRNRPIFNLPSRQPAVQPSASALAVAVAPQKMGNTYETLGIGNNIIGEGSFKALHKPQNAEVGFKLVLNKNESFDDFLIGTFNRSMFDAVDVYQEFLLYNDFGQIGISPKINYVIADGEQYSLRKLLSNIDVGAKIVQNIRRHIPANTQFIIEKYNCDDSIMEFFRKRDRTIDYAEFFSKLRPFIENIVVNHHYYNTDVKVPNLCIDKKTGLFKMIDLDPKFVKKVPKEEQRREIENYYIDCMIYQVYIFLVICDRIPIHIRDTGINERSYYAMMDFIVRKNEIHTAAGQDEKDPLYMLYWYSQQRREYRNRNHQNSREVADLFTTAVRSRHGNIGRPAPPSQSQVAMSFITPIQNPVGLGKKSRRKVKRTKKQRFGTRRK